MASRRKLKKSVNYICNTITGICLLDTINAPAEKHNEYRDVFVKINNMQNDIISRISHTEPGNVKLFYKKLKEDCNRAIDEIFSKLEELRK